MASKPEIVQIAERFEPRLRNALIAAFNAMRDRVPLSLIQHRLEGGGIEGVMNLLTGISDDLGPVRDELRAALTESGRKTVAIMPNGAIVNSSFQFDLINPSTVDFVRQYELNLIRLISENTREAIRNGLIRDVISGRNPRDTARAFRASIGLTPAQEKAIRNYRRALEQLDPIALQRKLRDGRFDRTIRNAIARKKPLSPAQIDKMVERYRERFIKHRSQTIARTESMRAVTVGQRASIRQMIAEGAIDPMRVRRFWVYTRDRRTRDGHRQIPGMNPEGVPLEGVYQTPDGPLAFPRDPNGTAENTVQCRCAERFEIVEME